MSSSQRLTLKQADEQDRRNRFSSHRTDETNRIRKQKKHDYLARKRQFAAKPPPETIDSHNAISEIDLIQPLMKEFCSIPMLDSLKKLHDALQTTSLKATADNYLVVLQATDTITASSLIGHLRGLASTPDGLPLALNILVRLTSISCVSVGGSGSSYYGNIPLSWSSLVSQNGAWLSHLVQLAPQSETACIVLGNLVGEANAQSLVKLRQAGLIPALISAIHQPAAAWALTNAIRHDTAEYAQVYCNEQALTAPLLEQLLTEEPVATQAAWMLVSLTNREEEVVQYLMGHPTFATTLVQCMKSPVSKDQLAPLIQALGNIATTSASNGGPPFSSGLITALPTLVPMLGQLLQIPTNKEVVQQAAWLTSCLLTDAGIPNHPATMIAAPILIPRLFQELRENTPHSFGNQCELIEALWAAIDLSGMSVPTTEVALPPWEIVRSALFTLVKLASSVAVEVSFASLCVLNILLERDDDNSTLLQALQENDLEAILEQICEESIDQTSHLAAKMLDNYFYNDNDDGEIFDNSDNQVQADGTFGFGIASGMIGSSLNEQEPGRGRGRGAPVPAWMEASKISRENDMTL